MKRYRVLIGLLTSCLVVPLACTGHLEEISEIGANPATAGGAPGEGAGGWAAQPSTDVPGAGGNDGLGTGGGDDAGGCTEGMTCGAGCVDPLTDPEHCGGCNLPCQPAIEQCLGGTCQCTSGFTDCFGACVDLLADGQHCGACGSPCGSGEVCFDGGCVTECPAELEECSQACVDTQASNQHCGGCDNPCQGSLTCADGQCGCASGTQCGTSCVDTQTSNQHCGGCDQPCTGGRACSAGQCECGNGQTFCGSSCVDTQTSNQHCGGCNQACGTTCSGGTCPSDPEPGSCPSVTNPTVEVTGSGSSWTIQGQGGGTETRTTIKAAIERAFARLGNGRTSKQSVVVRGSGSIGQNERISIPSYTILDVCGTIHVNANGGTGDQAPFYSRGTTDIEIPHASITGAPLYGMFFRNVNNLHLGQIDLRLDGVGLGIRIDNHGGDQAIKLRNIRIDDVYVQGTGAHGVETYGVDGLTIGRVVARNTRYVGLILNNTINAQVGLVDGEDASSPGTGYATFRIANGAGRVGSSWVANTIRVGEVRARRGDRGIFCVSDSGGLTVERVDIANTSSNSILLENCHNTRIATIGGTIANSGELRIASRTNEHTLSSNITVQNLTVTGTTIRENPCGNNIRVCNVTTNSNVTVCTGTRTTTCP